MVNNNERLVQDTNQLLISNCLSIPDREACEI